LNAESVDPAGVIREVVDLYASGDMPISFDLIEPDPPLSILADRGQFRQLLINLVRNAQEAQREQRLAIQIRIEPACGDNGQPGVTILLRDNGPGFSSEVLVRIFEPYVTTKPRGSGLGLPIVR